MRIAKLLPVTILAGVLTLPFTAPILCTIVNPTMSVGEMAARHGTVAVDDPAAGVLCNFGQCATAPVAPTVDLVHVPNERTVVSVDVAGPARSVMGNPRSPLTPPPQA